MTYRQIVRKRYERSAAGWWEAFRDLVAATGWLIRPLMMLAVLGWGQPRLPVGLMDGTDAS